MLITGCLLLITAFLTDILFFFILMLFRQHFILRRLSSDILLPSISFFRSILRDHEFSPAIFAFQIFPLAFSFRLSFLRLLHFAHFRQRSVSIFFSADAESHFLFHTAIATYSY